VTWSEAGLGIGPFLSVTVGILALFLGKAVAGRWAILREWHIPEPVVGGLLLSTVIAAAYFATGVPLSFELTARDVLLIYFFTTVGMSARLADLKAGGRPLVVLLIATVTFIVAQNLVGIGVAGLVGLPRAVGLIAGSVSQVGGHGTAIAWAPVFAADAGIANALEIGVACATLGLIMASLLGGPGAKGLIQRYRLESTSREELAVGVEFSQEAKAVDAHSFLGAILAIHVSVIVGLGIHAGLARAGLAVPQFVACLFGGLILSNTLPALAPRLGWPVRSTAVALVAEVALGVFLAMSLMSMQIWTLSDLALPVLTILAAQGALAFLFARYALYFGLGGGYDAAVTAAGFVGFGLGATPTAIANMTAVTKKHGPSPLAFLIVPLVAAVFIDLVNAIILKFMLARL
jgi:ESS family glutamate:Na+ symporter